ncbi:MAG: TlpA family protein disulfide reductase [Spongiibacteraceae bacterium]
MKKYAIALLGLLLWAGTSQAAEVADFDLKNYRGKLVYLDFWASWCGPCRASFPFMNKLRADYQQDLVVVSVNVDEQRDDAAKFLREFPASFPVFYDPKGSLASKYQVRGMPSSYLFNRRGDLIKQHSGFNSKTPTLIRSDIDRALTQ